MRVVYTGPIDAVEFDYHGRWIVATRGEPVEVDNDFGAKLCEQDCWAEHRPRPTKVTKNGEDK